MTDLERQQFTSQYTGTLFQHTDGGIYEFVDFSLSSQDGTSYCVSYKHVWPFKQQLWHRPEAEWTDDRFKPISREYATGVMTQNRLQAQADIKAKRDARKAAASVK